MKPEITQLEKELRTYGSKRRRLEKLKFFRTEPGGYGEGDDFLGVMVPPCRKIAKKYQNLSLGEIETVLRSKYHEERLVALLMMVLRFENGTEDCRKKIYKMYLRNTRHINNWDLVDTSAAQIVGGYLEKRAKTPIEKLSQSKNLWEKRIAMVSTFQFIKNGENGHTFKIAKTLLHDEHDLIHKAVGWMLREAGNRNRKEEEAFLKKHYKKMPRTMLRYAIERFPEKRRQAYLKGRI